MKLKTNYAAWLAFVAICIIWGTTYVALRIGVESIPPFLFSAVRQTTAGLLLLGLVRGLGGRLPEWRQVPQLALAGLLSVGLGNGLVAYAEQTVESNLAAVLCSSLPIWVVLITLRGPFRERLNPMAPIGVTLGFGGILILFWQHLAETRAIDWAGLGILLFSSISWALSVVLSKRSTRSEANPFGLAGTQLLFGGLSLIPLSLAFDDYTTFELTLPSVLAFGYLFFIGSLVAYGCYNYALAHLPTSVVAAHAYVNPLVAVFLGWLLLNEPLSTSLFAGLACILTAVYFINTREIPLVFRPYLLYRYTRLVLLR
jgi:drug/metabolite transporter (DMT)-like permease